MSTVPLTLLDQREIEARIVGPIYRAFAVELGEERAAAVLARVVRDLARSGGCQAAIAAGGAGLPQLRQAVERWRAGDALEIHFLRADEHALEFDVTRCRFAEMYRRLGLADLGGVLSCNRDAAMVEGFNPSVEFTRTQTILGGASHCDFRYRLADAGEEPPTDTGRRPRGGDD